MKLLKHLSALVVMVAIVSLAGCWDNDMDVDGDVDFEPEEHVCGDKSEMAERSYLLSAGEQIAWHKNNLYDAVTDSYYLPPELFYATSWDGNRQSEAPVVDDYTGGAFCTHVVGPDRWTHPETGQTISIYRRSHPSYTEYFRPGDQGFELVFDSLRSAYYTGAVTIPSGDGWRIQEPKTRVFGQWQQGVYSEHTQSLKIEEIVFDREGVLAWVVFRRSVDGKTVGEQMLEPKRGFTRSYVFKDDVDIPVDYDCGDKAKMEVLSYALSEQEKLAWGRENLYDDSTDSYFIPPELWTGAVWDGDKAMDARPADLYFGPTFCKHISGPTDWTHPINNTVYQIYTRAKPSVNQYFVISQHGVGRVYDSRYGDGGRYYDVDVKFPAGPGWRVGERVKLPFRQWTDGVVKDKYRQLEITNIRFDEDDVLASLTYRYWANETLDHEYTYMPRRGMVYLYRFSE